MDRTIYLRNTILFILFVAIVFAAPFVFANELSSPSFIQIDNAKLTLFNSKGESLNTVLSKGTVLQLPDGVTNNLKYYENTNNINLNKTFAAWYSLAAEGKTLKVREASDGSILFPVKVQGSGEIGYVKLGKLAQDPTTYSTTRVEMQTPKVIDQETTSNESETESPFAGVEYDDLEISYYNAEEYTEEASQHTEATYTEPAPAPEVMTEAPTQPVTPDPIDTSLRPQMRPYVGRPGDLSEQANFQCRQSWRSQRQDYHTNNCLSRTYSDFKEKIQHILNDLEGVNQMRAPRIPTDPRFSLCIASHESHLSPSAVHRDSGGGAWGMYQIRNTTGAEAISYYDPITPGFQSYDTTGEYHLYREKMLGSTFAQADLHHTVLLKKAKYAGLLQKLGSNSMTNANWFKLASRYNGGTRCFQLRGRTKRYQYHYADHITACQNALKPLVSEYGQINPSTTERQLKNALAKARFSGSRSYVSRSRCQ